MMPLPWYGRLAPGQRADLPARRDALAADAMAFFAPEAAHIPGKTFHVVAEIVAAAAPDLAPERLAPSVRFCIWMYLLDYYVDEMPGIDAAHLEDLQRRVDAALAAPPLGAPGTPYLETALRCLCGALATGPAAPALFPVFRRQVAAEVDAARVLHGLGQAVRAGEALPAVGDFLRLATDGVNHTSCTMSLLLAVGDPLSPAQAQGLRAPLAHAARAVRLANDLRTHSKDDAEGRLHSLRYVDAATALDQARAGLSAMDAALDALLRDGFPAATASALRAISHIGVQVYGVSDIKLDL